MAFNGSKEVVASAARTATGNSGSLALTPAKFLNLVTDVTANSGTGQTLDFSVQWSQDGGTTFAVAQAADSFTQVTTVNSAIVKQFAVKGPHYRVVWTIAGTTPSYTFSVREYLT